MSLVLVVEDSPLQREMIATLLQNAGFQVVMAGDGVEAIAVFEKTIPHLVVVDVVMPNMNGYELCRQLKNNDATKHIPIVMCSTKAEEFDRYWGMRQGADAYVSKPFQPDELVGIVQGLIKKK
ncbi:MAG: PleD family two-component system response regulator [Pseudanabaenaceae cyanobacterium]|jgi:twitching motility two-component system response regulator PilH